MIFWDPSIENLNVATGFTSIKSHENAVALLSAISATILLLSLKRIYRHRLLQESEESNVQWKKVGKIDKLYLYPLKGGRGLDVQQGCFEKLGMGSEDGLHDRNFMLVDEKR